VEVLNTLLTIIYIFCSLFLGFVVLIQKGEGGGLGGLAGGGAAVDTAFGAKADMTWKRATAVGAMAELPWSRARAGPATLFMTLAIVLGVLASQLEHKSSIAAESKRVDQKKNASAKTGAKTGSALGTQSSSPGAKPVGDGGAEKTGE
jgi:protein translocase SecG subunit